MHVHAFNYLIIIFEVVLIQLIALLWVYDPQYEHSLDRINFTYMIFTIYISLCLSNTYDIVMIISYLNYLD